MDSLHPVYILIGGMIGISVLVLIGLKIYMNRAMRDSGHQSAFLIDQVNHENFEASDHAPQSAGGSLTRLLHEQQTPLPAALAGLQATDSKNAPRG